MNTTSSWLHKFIYWTPRASNITYNLPYNNNVHTAWNSLRNSMIQGISKLTTNNVQLITAPFSTDFKNLGLLKRMNMVAYQHAKYHQIYLFTAKKGKVRLYICKSVLLKFHNIEINDYHLILKPRPRRHNVKLNFVLILVCHFLSLESNVIKLCYFSNSLPLWLGVIYLIIQISKTWR